MKKVNPFHQFALCTNIGLQIISIHNQNKKLIKYFDMHTFDQVNDSQPMYGAVEVIKPRTFLIYN